MKAEDIKLSDISRILFGQTPPSFLIEVIIRFLVIFIILLVAIRLSGKSQVGSQSRTQLASMVSLAAAIGIAMQVPERGLVPALIVAIIIVSIQRLVSYWAFRNRRFANVVHGQYAKLVENGVFQLKDMRNIGLSKERVSAAIRQKQIAHLGMIERMYMEADGTFTILEANEPKPGLSMFPLWDREFRALQKKDTQTQACSNCGNSQPKDTNQCKVCGQEKWEAAVIA